MRLSKSVAAVVLCVLIAVPGAAQAATHTPSPLEQQEHHGEENGAEPERTIGAPARVGLIFNLPSVLDRLDGYQGAGFGLKAFWERVALRGLLGLDYDSSQEQFELNVGATMEYHFSPGRLSPYAGGGLLYTYERDEELETRRFETGVAAVFGLEFAPLDFLSVFAEYSLKYSGWQLRADDGTTTNYSFSTQLGNQGAIGIIVYFLDRREPSAADDEPAES